MLSKLETAIAIVLRDDQAVRDFLKQPCDPIDRVAEENVPGR